MPRADVDKPKNDGVRPLQLAAMDGQLDTTRLLLLRADVPFPAADRYAAVNFASL